jgi:hypothetical protein
MKAKNGKPTAKFRVGDRVQFQWGGNKVWGTITEDGRIIGHNGPCWYTINIPQDPYEPHPWTKEEAELEPDTISRVPFEKSEIIEFLKNSGLVAMLISSPWRGPEDPPVWLCRSPAGMITYTFLASHGMVGGKIVPHFTLRRGDKIDARRKDEVADFLLGFGLTPEEAEDVIRAVGVSPVKKRRRKAEKA